jgi:hypothetical protein
MKQIAGAMARSSPEECGRSEDDMSIVQKIIRKTSNPKMAAVLALDLLLVGVDTVSTRTTCWQHSNLCPTRMFRGNCVAVFRQYHCISREQGKCNIK